MTESGKSPDATSPDATSPNATSNAKPPAPAETPAGRTPKRDRDAKRTEIGGRRGPDPTRYGDWEKNGRAVDF